MNHVQHNLYDFISGCGGNWHNAIYLSCSPCAHPCKLQRCGCLMTSDSMGRPILVSIARFEALTGQKVSPDECLGTLTRGAFSAAYARFLAWELESDEQCPLCVLESATYPLG